jgi:hypothetical protein
MSLADVLADMYPDHEDDARQAGVSVDAMMTAGDVLLDGLRDVDRGGRMLLRATWTFSKACWCLRVRGAIKWADLLVTEEE